MGAPFAIKLFSVFYAIHERKWWQFKISFCPVMDVILSTFHKERNGCTDFENTLFYCCETIDERGGYRLLTTVICHFKIAADYNTFYINIKTMGKTSFF